MKERKKKQKHNTHTHTNKHTNQTNKHRSLSTKVPSKFRNSEEAMEYVANFASTSFENLAQQIITNVVMM